MGVSSPVSESDLVGRDFVLPRALRTPVLASLGIAGRLIVTVVNWRLANRLARESQEQREALIHAGGRSSGGFLLNESN